MALKVSRSFSAAIDRPKITVLPAISSILRKLTQRGPDDHSVREQTHAHAVDHLVRGLIDLLPKADSIWRHEDRVNWLRLAADIFEIGYKSDGASGEISIVAVRQVAKPEQSLDSRAET